MDGTTGFGTDNLPYGVDGSGHVVVAWGNEVVDLTRFEGLDVDRSVWASGSLDAFMALGPDAWALTRRQIQDGITRQAAGAGRPRDEGQLVRPWTVGDYADFYASREHATNMGRLLRPGEDPLPPAWLHLPIGYHGRAGSVIVSGRPVHRPSGLVPGADGPALQPSGRLDVEVELGFVVGAPVAPGTAVDPTEAERHIFGVVLLNDWSARDIQAFEYRPLGPFLGKSFATSISPWVVPWAAFDRWRVPGPLQSPTPASYLTAAEPRNLDVSLRLTRNGEELSTTSSSGLYWSPGQQLAHLSVNGGGVRAGDLFASGTISGPEPGTEGSLMELYQAQRWLEDGDVVTIEGWCGDRSGRDWLSLGQVTAEVRP